MMLKKAAILITCFSLFRTLNAQQSAGSTTFILNRSSGLITDPDYQAMLHAIQKENFESGKLDLAEMFFGAPSVYLSSLQVIGVLKLFALDDKKLRFAKFAYPRTVDQRNYYKLLDMFGSSETKEEFSDFLEKTK